VTIGVEAQAAAEPRIALAFVAQVPDAECAGDTRFRRRLRLDTYGHYAVHTRAILVWRQGRAPART